MPTPARPASGPDAAGTAVPLSSIPLLDAEGTEIPWRSRVEQIAVNAAHGALPARLHHQGEVIGRGPDVVYVIFDREYSPTCLRSRLVRLIPASRPGESQP